jgi:hypothetical protein
VDYVPWPRSGCTLAEARERTAERGAWKQWRDGVEELKSQGRNDNPGHDENRNRPELAIEGLENGINAEFRLQIAKKRLVAYCRADRTGGSFQLIGNDVWPLLTKIDWGQSTAGDAERAEVVYSAVRVFPTLIAPCRVDLIAGCSLSEAFRSFVLEDPEVEALAKLAVKLSPEFERVLIKGHCHLQGGDEWPVAFERSVTIGVVHPDPHKRSIYDVPRNPDPLEVVIAAEALLDRYQTLIGILRRGELEAHGLPPTRGHSEIILRSIWSHDDFYFNADGDLFQVDRESEDPRNWLTRRWIGVVLQRSHAASPAQITSDSSSATMAGPPSTGVTSGTPDYPPFTIDDVIRLGSLSESLMKLVLRHPSVRKHLKNALEFSKKERFHVQEDAGLVVLATGHHEPLLPLRRFAKQYDDTPVDLPPESSEEGSDCSEFSDGWPPEIALYYDAVHLRARILIEMLQKREVVGRGHTADGQLAVIAHSIWSHEDYYIHPPTGDIYEGTPFTMTKIWSAVILERPSASRSVGMFHVNSPERDGVLPRTIPVQVDPAKLRKAVARVETSAASFKACTAWLMEIMRASPTERKITKSVLWEMAQEKWPGTLSERSFLQARSEVIRASGASAWGAAGASRKSKRKSTR